MLEKNNYLLRDEFVQTDTIVTAVAKATPPAAVSFVHYVMGVPIEKWLTACTIVYVCLQAYFLVSDRLRIRGRRFRFRTRKTD